MGGDFVPASLPESSNASGGFARYLGGHGFGNCLGVFDASRARLFTKLKLHGLNGPLEFDGEFLALGEGGAELTDFFFKFFQLGRKIFFE